jgi:hypothetical protein
VSGKGTRATAAPASRNQEELREYTRALAVATASINQLKARGVKLKGSQSCRKPDRGLSRKAGASRATIGATRVVA